MKANSVANIGYLISDLAEILSPILLRLVESIIPNYPQIPF